MSFMLDASTITNIADRAEKAIGMYSSRSSGSDRKVIENAIREALIEQAQKLITVIPASALSSGILNLQK